MEQLSDSPFYNFLGILCLLFIKIAVMDACFQIESSLLCLSEILNMTLRGSLTSNKNSLSSIVQVKLS